MMPKSCKDYCMNHRNCPEPTIIQFIEQLEKANHRLTISDLENICYGFMQDPTDNEDFIINIWGV